MSKRRSLLVITAYVLLLTLSSPAQSNDDKAQTQTEPSTQPQQGRPQSGRYMRRGRARDGMAALAQKLNLTDDQKQQFEKIRRATMQQAKSIRNDSSLSADQKREKMQELRRQQHQQMFTALTPEQKEQLKQLREQRKKQIQEKQKSSGDQPSAKNNSGTSSDDDDPFAGMTSDDDGPGNGGL